MIKFKIGQEVRHFTGGVGMITQVFPVKYEFTHLNGDQNIISTVVEQCELKLADCNEKIGFNGKNGKL